MILKYFKKIPTDKVYHDLFHPGMTKAGEALATILDIGNLVLLPLKLLNEKSRIYFKNNIEKYEEKLQKEKDFTLIDVPEYVGLPILDKFTYLNQEDLSEAFTNLLTKASFSETINLVHPAFITTLNNISADEAKLLFHLKDKVEIPFIDVILDKQVEKIPAPDDLNQSGRKTREQLQLQIKYAYQDRQQVKMNVAWNLTGLEKEVELSFPENIDLYLENLEFHGIIKYERTYYHEIQIDTYNKLETQVYSQTISDIKSELEKVMKEQPPEIKSEIRIVKGFIEFTEFGKKFLAACIKEIEKNEA